MGFIETIRSLTFERVFVAVMILLPVLDQEVLGAIPYLRDRLPVPTIPLLSLSWVERGRWVVLLLVPYLDGEIIELLTGQDARDVIES